MDIRRLAIPALAFVLGTALAVPAGAQTGVQFDGTNDYVTFGSTTSLSVSTFTVECWFKRTGAGATTSTGTGGVTAIPLFTKGRGEAEGSNVDMNFFLGLRADSTLAADYEEGTGQASPGLNHPITGTTVVRTGVWYHAAVTFDGTTLRLYLNGNLENTVVVGAGRLPQSLSIQHAGLGTAMTSAGTAAGFFAGAIDEARLWNVARTQAEIQAAALAPLASGAGLLARWGLDEGSGTVAANSVAGGVSGTLTNGPTWVAGSRFSFDYGLRFTGTSGYVTFGNNAALGLPAFTIETWFRRDGAGATASTGSGGVTAIPLVTKGYAEADGSNVDMNYFLGLRGTDGVLVADFEEGAGGATPGLNHPVIGVTPIAAGSGWRHAAATYDGVTWRLYLDGNLEATLAVGQPPQSASIQHAGLGTALNSTGVTSGAFAGALDETRVWNLARTQAEIQGAINTPIPGAQPGLVARWGMNEATGGTIASSAGTPVSGTLTGSGVGWTDGAPFNITSTPPAAPSGTFAAALDHDRVQVSWTDASGDETSFEIERSTTGAGGPFTPLASVPANATSYVDEPLSPSAEYCYRVRAVNGAGASAWDAAACATTPALTNRAAGFPGATSAYVTFGAAPSLNAAVFTVECWFRRDGAGVATTTGTGGVTDAIPLVAKGRGEAEASNVDLNYILALRAADGVLVADFEEGAGGASPSLNHPVIGVTPVATGSGWHHAAAAYDGVTWRLYLDGCLEATSTVGQPPASATTQHASIGTALTSTGVAAGAFAGAIDEVRIWSVARTESEIRAGLGTTIASAPGLLGRWGLDESLGTAAYATTGPNGTYTGAVTHVAAAPFADPLPPVVGVVDPDGGETLVVGLPYVLQWSTTDCFGVTACDLLVSRNGAGGPWEAITTGAPNTGSYSWPVTGPEAVGNAYFRVIAYDAAGNAATATSPAPFSIVDIATPAAIALFDLESGPDGIAVRWQFQRPGDVAEASLRRATSPSGPWSGVGAEPVADGARMRVLDGDVESGTTYWYRLEAVMRDGRRLVFGPIFGTAETVTEFALTAPSPNPTAGPVQMSFALPRAANVRLEVLDVQGRVLQVLADGAFAAGRHHLGWNGENAGGRLAPGAYFVRGDLGGNRFVRRLVVTR